MGDLSKSSFLIESLLFSFYSLISLALWYNKNIILSEGGPMQEFIAQFGDFAPIIYLLLASILPIFLFPPGIFSAIGGYLFGFTHGFILSIIASIIYTSVMFIISRYFASDYVEKYLAKKLSKKQYDTIFGISENKLMIFLIIYRLIPVLPNSVICYSYGLTRISFKKYFIGNIIGLIPGKMIWLHFGTTLNNIGSMEFLYGIIIVLAFIFISSRLSKRFNK